MRRGMVLSLIFIVLICAPVLATTSITDTNITTTGNLTVGQQIGFALGELIDNLIDGWLRITGNLNVTGNVTVNDDLLVMGNGTFSGNSLTLNNQEVCLANDTNCPYDNDTQWNITGSEYLTNNSGILSVNETILNSTIKNWTIFPMGEVSVTGNALSTSIASSDTWTIINAVWDGNPENMLFQNASNGTLTYIGNETMFFHIAMTISVESDGANDVMRAAVFKNGVLLPGAQIQQQLFGAGDVGSTAIHVATTLSNGDYLTVHVLNENDADDFTIPYANLFAMGMRRR